MTSGDRPPRASAAGPRMLIQAYGDGGFRVGGQSFRGSLLVFADGAVSWPVTGVEALDMASLAPVTGRAAQVGILLIGCGGTFLPPPDALRQGLKRFGVAMEWMDTGAACRTFNVLLQEDRPVAAALIAVD